MPAAPGTKNLSAVLDLKGTQLGPCLGDTFKEATTSCPAISFQMKVKNREATGSTKQMIFKLLLAATGALMSGLNAHLTFSRPVTVASVSRILMSPDNSLQVYLITGSRFYS